MAGNKLALNAFLFVCGLPRLLLRQKILKLFLRQMETIPGIRRDDRRGGLMSIKIGNGKSFDEPDTFHIECACRKRVAFVAPLETVTGRHSSAHLK